MRFLSPSTFMLIADIVGLFFLIALVTALTVSALVYRAEGDTCTARYSQYHAICER